MNKRFIRWLSISVIIFACLFTLSSCGKKGYSTNYAAATQLNKGKYDDAVDWVEVEVTLAKIEIELTNINEKLNGALTELERAELTNKKAKLENYKLEIYNIVLDANSATDYSGIINEINSLISTEQDVNKLKAKVIEIIKNYPNYEFISGVKVENNKDLEKQYKNYKVNLIRADIERYTGYKYMLTHTEEEKANCSVEGAHWCLVDNTYGVIGKTTDFNMLSTGISTTEDETIKNKNTFRDEFEKAFVTKSGCGGQLSNQTALRISNYNKETPYTNIYAALASFLIDVELRLVEQEPISFQLNSFGDFFANFFDNFLIYPVGWLLYFTSSIFGGLYIVGLFITTILIRTAGWPIYAKTNDMSLKMQVVQPEMQKLEEKYANRKDPDSQRMKQAELAQIYRKNKIGIGGCFLPFLQFPIFMAVYGAVRRFPYTVATPGSIFTLDWANTTMFGKDINSTLFGIPFDLFEDYTGGGTLQLVGIIVLVILVSGTQFLSQKLSEKRQKTNHQKAQEDIPAYRRQAYKQSNNQGQNTMKYVMYMMIFMMATFVFTSKAGLGIYWLIGNIYSMLQMFLNNLMGQKKLTKMKEKANRG